MRRLVLIVFFLVMTSAIRVSTQDTNVVYLYIQSHEELQAETNELLENLQFELNDKDYSLEIVPEKTGANVEITFNLDESGQIVFMVQPLTPTELPPSPILYAHPYGSFSYTVTDWNVQAEALATLTAGFGFYSVAEWHLAIELINYADNTLPNSDNGFYVANSYVALSAYEHATYEYFASVISPEAVPLYVNSIWTLLQLDVNWTSRYGGNRDFYLDYNFGVLDNLVNFYNISAPQVIEIWTARAQLYAFAFDYDSAIADMDAAIELAEANNISDEDLARLYTLRGEIIFLIYEWDRVLDNFNAALELDSGYAPAYFQRGVLYYTMAQRENALADFQHYLELAPDGNNAEEAQRYIDSIQTELDALGG